MIDPTTTDGLTAATEKGAPPTEGTSLLDRLVAQRAAGLERLHLDLPIPSWQGALVARYKVIDGATRDAMALREFEPDDDVGPSAMLMVNACVGLYLKDPDTGELVPVVKESDGAHARFDANARHLLGLSSDARTMEEVAEAACGHNPAALVQHSRTLGAWLLDPTPAPTSSVPTGSVMTS